MAYLDVEAAFCRASPALLLRELWEVGVVDEWHEIAALYEEVAAYAWYAGRATARWAVKAGVLQGSVLSPLLFNLYMNSLSDAVAAANTGLVQARRGARDECGELPVAHGAGAVIERRGLRVPGDGVAEDLDERARSGGEGCAIERTLVEVCGHVRRSHPRPRAPPS